LIGENIDALFRKTNMKSKLCGN